MARDDGNLGIFGTPTLRSPAALFFLLSLIHFLAREDFGKVSQPQFETAQPCSRSGGERDNPLPSGDHARREELSAAVVELVGLCSFALRLNEGASDDGVLKNEKE